ncbi:MAG: pilus assembly protein PilM [Oscillospiraceae bacterium]|nr:pilus assembly protein PilM [Oscillospiraceae bacterium]
MAKSILGIDIGYDSMKLALVKGGKVKKSAEVPMPKNLLRAGRVVSTESMGELIRTTMKQYGIRCPRAALVLPNEAVFVRNVLMPVMTADQLKYNLPFEFRDYITEELKNYVFDYAMISTAEEIKAATRASKAAKEAGDGDETAAGSSMELIAVAAQQSLIEDAREYTRKAGLKLVKAAPTVSCYQALIRARTVPGGPPEEYCILDLGYQAIRMYMFRGERHIVTRELEVGLRSLISAIADAASVDEHLAHTYLLENYQDWQNNPVCQNAYENISVELIRALNFYRFSNPDSRLEDLYLTGGGSMIRPLRKVIADTVGIRVHAPVELVPDGADVPGVHGLVQAIGVTMN